MRLPRAEAERMLAHLRAAYPFEGCGAFVGRGAEAARVVPLVNGETAMPKVRYQIDAKDLVRTDAEARVEGLEIIGYFHSHPDHPARPSETDRQRAADTLSDGVIHVVVGVEGGERTTPTAWVFRDETKSFDPEPFEIT